MREYGFIKPTITQDNYIFGGTGLLQQPINDSGDWTKHLPSEESQFNRFIDSMGCTIFGSLNCWEILAKFKFGKEWNKSERFVGAFSEMTHQGNNPHKVVEAARHYGLIDEEIMPLIGSQSFEELWSKQEAEKHKAIGEKFLKQYTIKHDWVFGGLEMVKSALKHSPLGVDVYAWATDENGMYFRPQGLPSTHWTALVKIEDGGYEKENHAVVFDSYPPYIKKVRLDMNFTYIKRYILDEYIPCWKRLWRIIPTQT